MAPLAPLTVNYGQMLSMALEDRSSGYQDLVSNHNALLAMINKKGMWKTYSGPRIRETLQIDKADPIWYNGYMPITPTAIELFNDAYWTPKMVVIPITLSMEEILNNQGEAQLMDVMESYIDAGERALEDAMDISIHSNGLGHGGLELGGLGMAIPIVPTTGLYGGIERATAPMWQTTTFNAQVYDTAIGTQVNSTTIRPFLNKIMTARSRGRRHADILLMSPQHYAAYDAATTAVQRITKEGGLAKLGFSTLEYIGGGKSAEIVLDGGIGSNMPANTTYGIETQSFRMRYNPSRNFDKLFPGDGMKYQEKDAIAQYIGWMGELTMVNPLFHWRFHDADPATLMVEGSMSAENQERDAARISRREPNWDVMPREPARVLAAPDAENTSRSRSKRSSD